jgi:hypothetical protein
MEQRIRGNRNAEFYKAKMRSRIILFVLAFIAGCALHRVPIDTGIVYRDTNWIAVEQNTPGMFLIVSKDAAEESDAVKKVCSKDYVCLLPVWAGRALIVQRKAK